MPGGAGEEVDELLLPPTLEPGSIRPLSDGTEINLSGDTMGTSWSLSAVLPKNVSVGDVASKLEDSFATVIAQMSQWEPESDISRFNRAAAGTSFSLPLAFAYVLDGALQIARASGGAFDPTLGQASDLWGFGAQASPHAMPDTARASATRQYSWRDVHLAEEGQAVEQPGGLALDFSGIAKGFAVDFAMAALQRLGIGHALLEIGGELRGVGVRADGLPWWVDLDCPPGSTAPITRIGLTGWSVATTGNYRRRREAEGHSWSHTLDPVSAMPLADDRLSVTVLHKGCMQADALATAIMVMEPELGLLFADRHGIPARIVTRDVTVSSAAWQAWLD